MSRSQKLQQDVLEYLENNRPRFLSAIRELAQIPAPSGQEELRAQWCKQYLESLGATGVYIDEALNVIFPYGDMNGDLCAILGHTDIVFPDTTPLPFKEENGSFCISQGCASTARSITRSVPFVIHDVSLSSIVT